MIMNVLSWVVFGLIAGVLAKFVGKETGNAGPAGMIGTIVLGIIGAAVGGFVSSRLFGWDVNTFSIAGLAVAVAGAVLLLFIYHMIMSSRRTA
jgi:uncharacterized membrane protein YeaQ/YmgE (transglycosylase-associated protein family)